MVVPVSAAAAIVPVPAFAVSVFDAVVPLVPVAAVGDRALADAALPVFEVSLQPLSPLSQHVAEAASVNLSSEV